MSSQNRPGSVSVRHDTMGRARVVELLSNRALLVSDRNDIVVTPTDSYDRADLDLTTVLSKDQQVVFKATRIAEPDLRTRTRYMAVFVRPLSDCLLGEGEILKVIENKFAFIQFSHQGKFDRIFFPTSGIRESVLDELIWNQSIEFSKLVRAGDRVDYVAVHDASTKGKAAFGIEVTFAFNKDLTKSPIVGIVVAIRRTSFDVWVKNFRDYPFELTAFEDLGIDRESGAHIDLREILQIGTRLKMKAVPTGELGQFEMKNVAITDFEENMKLKMYVNNCLRKNKSIDQNGANSGSAVDRASNEDQKIEAKSLLSRSKSDDNNDFLNQMEQELQGLGDFDNLDNLDIDSNSDEDDLQNVNDQEIDAPILENSPQENIQSSPVENATNVQTGIDISDFNKLITRPSGGFWADDKASSAKSTTDDDQVIYQSISDQESINQDRSMFESPVSEFDDGPKKDGNESDLFIEEEIIKDQNGSEDQNVNFGESSTKNEVNFLAKTESQNSASTSPKPTTISSVKKEQKDAQCQVELDGELEILNDLLRDQQIFKMACDRYTPFMHEMWMHMKR